MLIYETFAQAHAALGRPRRPEFLLRPGELIDVLRAPATPVGQAPSPSENWRVIAFEEGRLPARGESPEREVQRIVAEELPYVSLFYRSNVCVYNKRIDGVKVAPDANWRFLTGIRIHPPELP